MSGNETRTPIISLVPMGNMGNRAIQYLCAAELRRRLGRGIVANVEIPELGISIPQIPNNFHENECITIFQDEHFNLNEIVTTINTRNIKYVTIWHYCQRMEYLPTPALARALIPYRLPHIPQLPNDCILINIRGGEILEGYEVYPIVPFQFYEQVVQSTKLKPVFMGQTENPAIKAEILARFPNAPIIESGGIEADFAMMRSAKNLVISTSTFSWLAAYLSVSTKIHMLMIGLFNSAHLPDVDLLAVWDERFQFYQAPFVFGLSLPDILRHYENPQFQQFPRKTHGYVEKVKTERHSIKRDIKNDLKFFDPYFYELKYPEYKNYRNSSGWAISALDHFRIIGFQQRCVPFFFHEAYYLHRYVDAAWDISDGLYEDAYHHYTEIGHALGYLPRHPDGEDIATGKAATQSSVAAAFADETPEINAIRALDGDPFTFCATQRQSHPWWQIDLGDQHEIYRIVVCNKSGGSDETNDMWPIHIYTSGDGETWKVAYWGKTGHHYRDEQSNFFEWYCWHKLTTRFLRIVSPRSTTLQLGKIAVIGNPAPI
jgi:hypothetical protein